MNKKLKTILKQNKIIYGIWSIIRKSENILNDIRYNYLAVKNFKEERKLNHRLVDGKLNVGFVFTQELSDWSKIGPIFMALKNDNRFALILICFPPWLGAEKIMDSSQIDKSENTNFDFFKNEFLGENIKIINGCLDNDEVVDLKQFDFSYVFYNSPYPVYAPVSYHPSIVSKYTKICYTPYGFTLSEMFRPISSSWSFFRWLYCCYCVSENEKKYFDERLKKKKTLKYQRNAFCGFPRIYQFMKYKNMKGSMWDFSKNDFRVIWTPRWSTENSIGGSNFLKYNNFMLNLTMGNPDIDFVFRPHPLAFGNFIKTGQMSKSEVDDYKVACVKENLRLDETAEYAPTFWQSNVLITDFSSVIIEYFITGNPIIFCTTKTNRDLPTEEFEMILLCCYIADNEDEISGYLKQLHSGDDPLKEKRLETINEIFGDTKDIEHIPERIANDLWQDYIKTIEKGTDK